MGMEYKVLVKDETIELGPYLDDEMKEYFIRVTKTDEGYNIRAIIWNGEDSQQLRFIDLNSMEIETIKSYFEGE